METLNDELAKDFDLPTSLYLPVGQYASRGRATELADRLLGLMSRAEAPPGAAEEMVALGEPLQAFLRQQLERADRVSVPDTQGDERAETEAPGVAVTCTIELAPYNPGFWNNNATIRLHNNCYNYASNKRTDTFAQPGRGCGRMYTAITCPEVTRASLCDGLHRRYDCFSDAERPRYLVALVVAPGPGFNDFHWYRKLKEGFWGHKPGSTAARNVDNSVTVR